MVDTHAIDIVFYPTVLRETMSEIALFQKFIKDRWNVIFIEFVISAEREKAAWIQQCAGRAVKTGRPTLPDTLTKYERDMPNFVKNAPPEIAQLWAHRFVVKWHQPTLFPQDDTIGKPFLQSKIRIDNDITDIDGRSVFSVTMPQIL